MDLNTTIGVLAAVVVIVGSIYYLNMGGSVSSTSNAVKAKGDAKGETEKSKGDSKKYPAGLLHVFFGSQTGTAEGFARTVMEEGKQNGFDAKIVDLEDFDPESLADVTNAVFLMATYGEGEPTDNSAKFITWLRDQEGSIEKGFLSKTCFTVFGLGNKQYEHFNAMGRTTNELLEKHGARRVCAYGEGDDDSNLEEDFDKWREGMWPVLISAFHPDGASATEAADGASGEGGMSESRRRARTSSKVELEFRTMTVLDEDVPDLMRSRVYDTGHFDTDSTKLLSSKSSPGPSTKSSEGKLAVHSSTKYYFIAAECQVVENKELRHPSDGGCTRHIEINLAGSGVSYQTADNLAVLPENSDEVVNGICDNLGYNPDEFFVIVSTDETDVKFKHIFPTPCTIGDAIRRYCDVQCIPRHATMCSLLPYVTDSKQREWLEKITDKANRPLFKTTIEEGGLSLSVLLAANGELSSCRLPLADFIHITPRLQPRYYTISSSSSVHPNTVHITVALTEKNLPSGRKFIGVCSGDLVAHVPVKASGRHSSKAVVVSPRSLTRVFVRASTFRLPASLETPVLMIGPGTGIAPMRALLQEREFQMEQLKKKGSKKGNLSMENVLYFGCKNRSLDYIYQDELEDYEARGILSKLHVAFSREQKEKVYVQHLIQRDEDAKNITRMLLDENGYVFVCGATAMGNDVHEALLSVLQNNRGMTAAAAVDYLKDLQHAGRYVQELWSA